MATDKTREDANQKAGQSEERQFFEQKKRKERQEATGEQLTGEELLLPAESEQTPILSVVMPTLNEEGGVAKCIERIVDALEELQVYGEVIVSDSSTDRTPEIAAEHGAIIVTPDRSGYGYAYRYAFQYARGEYVAIGDADTTYDFAELPRLYSLIEEGDADIAMGSRLRGEIRPGAMPWLHQYVGNPLLTKFLNIFYRADVSDAHSGFRVIRRSTLEDLDLRTDGMEFASEMIMEATAHGLTIAEVPITYHEREGEATLESFRDGWQHVRFMLVNAPGYLFSIPGVLLVAAGTLLIGVSLLNTDPFGVTLGVRGVITGCLAILVGVQVFSFGVFTAVAGDPIRIPTDRLTRIALNHIGLETGVTTGLFIFIIGATYLVGLALGPVSGAIQQTPPLMLDILALTATVLGLQAIFSSFFLSALEEK